MIFACLDSRLPHQFMGRDGAGAVRPSSAPEAIAGVLLVLSLAGLARVAVDPSPYLTSGFRLDRITAAVALFVAGIGLAAVRYATRCLEAQPRHQRLMAWMAAATVASWLLTLSDSFVAMVLAWLTLGLCLQRMLSWSWHADSAPLRTRFPWWWSVAGDAMLALAFGLAWAAYGSTDLTSAVEHMAADPTVAWPTAIILLATGACAIKTAQVPLHGWLPRTVDAPTPVSALMHAGIINAGGVLLVRMAPAIERVPEAWMLMSIVASASMLVAVPTAWFQSKAKSALAWSTVGQMGFMMAQCGLCAFPAAFLHVLGHGTYKAWSFLGAGEVTRMRHSQATPARTLALLAIGAMSSLAGLAAVVWMLGVPFPSTPGKLALTAVVGIATGQCWVALLGDPGLRSRRASRALLAAALSVTLPAVALTLYLAAAAWIGMSAEAGQQHAGPVAWIAAILPVLTIACLAVLHALMPHLEGHPLGLRLRVHATNGFYVAMLVNRTARHPHPTHRPINPGAAHA
jgi:NAD(P)H-quinone oxidoreductase subunit 5